MHKRSGTQTELVEVGTTPPLGVVPKRMHAVVIRKGKEGEPVEAMRPEVVDVPEPGPDDVLVWVMAAGVNFNGIWASRGKPVSIMGPDEDFHISGSDASGYVWKIGSNVKRWKVGDEVVVHCNHACGQCPECNGFDPLACTEQRIWGYETNYGSFAQLCKVQAQQLLRKPPQLGWVESASYGLTYFTAYRMLVDQAKVRPGDNVLVWGASGGLGIFAVQICKTMGANAIAVVSSERKAELARRLGAVGTIDRRDFDLSLKPGATPEDVKRRSAEMKRFGKAIREITDGRDPDVVFEHVGQQTFPTSVFVAKRFGTIVICGATSGYHLEFDVRHLWMRQKRIIGSHFANAYEAERANRLVAEGKIVPYVDRVFPFEKTGFAHAEMAGNRHMGKMVITVGAPFVPAHDAKAEPRLDAAPAHA